MTYLELFQKVCRECGTVPNPPATVTGLTGRLASILGWTSGAWTEIQLHRPGWLWMRREFDGPALAGNRYLDATDLGIVRLAHFVYRDSTDGGPSGLSIYGEAAGVASERTLFHMPWATYRDRFLRGVQTGDAPSWFSIDNQGRVALGPVPIVDSRLRGEYQADVQPLVEPTDVPEMPSRFHDLIVWRALVLLSESDESTVQDPAWRVRARMKMQELEASQLPRITFGKAMA